MQAPVDDVRDFVHARSHTGLNQEDLNLVRQIETGGTTALHLAQRSGSRVPVVVRSLLKHLAPRNDLVEVFVGESTAAAQLKHPHIVQVEEVRADHDEFRVVYEYVPGLDVEQVQRLLQHHQVRMPVACACRLIADVMDGLAGAHDAVARPSGEGLLHRGVRPSRILLGEDGHTRVTGFGLALLDDRYRMTRPGTLKSKLSYASPEQVTSNVVDRRSDLFQAAVVFWELLVGRPLFMADSPAAVLRGVLEKPIDPPSRYNRAVPEALDVLVLQALERDPERRLAGAEVFRDRVDMFLRTLGLRVTHEHVSLWCERTVRNLGLEENKEDDPGLDSVSSPDGARAVFSFDDTAPTTPGRSARGQRSAVGKLVGEVRALPPWGVWLLWATIITAILFVALVVSTY